MSELGPTLTYSDRTATDELRRLLDERGVKYVPEIVSEGTLFVVTKDVRTYYILAREKGFKVWSEWLTPAQVIAATLGAETCRIEERRGDWYCTGCDELVGTVDTTSELYIDGNAVELWGYCPRCGRKRIDA